VVNFTPRGKSARYPLYRRLGGAQCQSGRRSEHKILYPTGTRTRPLGRPARSQSLYRLRYPASMLYIHTTFFCLITWPHAHQFTSTLKMGAAGFSEMLLAIYNATCCHKPEYHKPHYEILNVIFPNVRNIKYTYNVSVTSFSNFVIPQPPKVIQKFSRPFSCVPETEKYSSAHCCVSLLGCTYNTT
jgi:hypothetical protein